MTSLGSCSIQLILVFVARITQGVYGIARTNIITMAELKTTQVTTRTSGFLMAPFMTQRIAKLCGSIRMGAAQVCEQLLLNMQITKIT